jgi:hypothetical protein
MPRPKGDDPRRAVTLRIKASTLARYAALGEDWRAKMEAAIERFGMPSPLPVAPKVRAAERKPHVSRLKGEWKAP